MFYISLHLNIFWPNVCSKDYIFVAYRSLKLQNHIDITKCDFIFYLMEFLECNYFPMTQHSCSFSVQATDGTVGVCCFPASGSYQSV